MSPYYMVFHAFACLRSLNKILKFMYHCVSQAGSRHRSDWHTAPCRHTIGYSMILHVCVFECTILVLIYHYVLLKLQHPGGPQILSCLVAFLFLFIHYWAPEVGHLPTTRKTQFRGCDRSTLRPMDNPEVAPTPSNYSYRLSFLGSRSCIEDYSLLGYSL